MPPVLTHVPEPETGRPTPTIGESNATSERKQAFSASQELTEKPVPLESEAKGKPGEIQSHDDEKEEDETVNEYKDLIRILRGDFTNLPPAKTNIIRIFLSSTFSGD